MTRRPDKWCHKCNRMVPWYHEHWGRAERVAWPEIEAARGKGDPRADDEGEE